MFKKYAAVVCGCLIFLTACDGVSSPSEKVAKETISKTHAEEVSAMPNVVFILVDDMGFGDVGYLGSEIATPNLDQIANAGVQLNRNYVFPVCSPTRAALLTGQNPLSLGVDGPIGDHAGLPLDTKIMPEYFKDLGYQTFMVGKWHLGIGNTDYWPLSRGFDYHYGTLGGWIDFYTHMYSEGLDWQRQGVSLREEGYATDLLTDDAIRMIEARNPDSPMFMYLAYNAPHSPLQHPPEYSGLNDFPEVSDRSVYAEMVTQADAGIGRVLSSLKSEGMLENTIIVFSSDNGGVGTQGADNGFLRAGKGSAFEGGIRVPGLIWWPGQVEGGRVMDQPLVAYDWLPTLLDAAGGNMQYVADLGGNSLWGAIANDENIEPELAVIGISNSKAVIDWPWKLVRHERGEVHGDYLFNILEDPSEQIDLSAQLPEKFAELIAIVEALPQVDSLGVPTGKPSPMSFYGKREDGGWDYDYRSPETVEPWAEAAASGSE